MSDLYSLIQRSIIDRGLTSAAAREEVYRQARTAVIRELWSYEPTLGDEEIEARMAQFDRAIDQLESDLSAAFADPAEAPPARPPRQSARGAVSVFEGYDRDTDYVPGYIARQPRRPDPESAAKRRPHRPSSARQPDEDGGLDPLALRSAAIEAALRSGGDDLVYDSETAANVPADVARDERSFDGEVPFGEGVASHSGDRQERWTGNDDEGYGEDGWGGDDPAPPMAKPDPGAEDDWRSRGEPARSAAGRAMERLAALPASLKNLSERSRVRVLIGAIAALGILLVVFAGLVLWSFLASGRAPPAGAGPSASESGAALPTGDVVHTFTVFDGGDPTVFESGSGNPVHFDKNAGFARITSSTSDPGVRVMIGPGLAGRISGRPVRVTLVARTSQENGAASLRFAYENGLAISPWQTAHLDSDFASYSLVWRIPAMRADPGSHQLLIEPGIPGEDTAADIQLIKIDVLKSEPQE